MVRPIRYPHVVALVSDLPSEARAVAQSAAAELAHGRDVNIIFEHHGTRVLVARITHEPRGFHVGHGHRPATKHSDMRQAIDAAVLTLERSIREVVTPRHARSGTHQWAA